MKSVMLHWTPRVLAILAIIFMMIFSLDCFEENKSIGNQLLCFLMHNIPAFICIAALIIAWKWQMIGGILFFVFFIAAAIFFRSFTGNPASLIVIAPFLITGILFILDYTENKKKAVT